MSTPAYAAALHATGTARTRNLRGLTILIQSLGLAVLTALPLAGCKTQEAARGGEMTLDKANKAISRAIRQSSEGVILLPSRKASAVYELPRLNEIAHELRQPAAECFVRSALETMEPDASSASGFSGVPNGQAKLRLRISAAGRVLRSEVLESGFASPGVPNCMAAAISSKRFPENKTGTTQYVDLVFWVSLGVQGDLSKVELQRLMRREQVEAGIRAKKCLAGRVQPGSYVVEGLNLISRTGATVANRVKQETFSGPLRQCLATAFRGIRLPAASETFLRPALPTVEFNVSPSDEVTVTDETWLRMIKLEERAKRAAQRAELAKDSPETEAEDIWDRGPAPESVASPTTNPRTTQDPGKGGLILELKSR